MIEPLQYEAVFANEAVPTLLIVTNEVVPFPNVNSIVSFKGTSRTAFTIAFGV